MDGLKWVLNMAWKFIMYLSFKNIFFVELVSKLQNIFFVLQL